MRATQLGSFALLGLLITGCAPDRWMNGPATAGQAITPTSAEMAQMREMCPTLVPGTQVTSRNTANGIELTFSNERGHVSEVRDRVESMAAMYDGRNRDLMWYPMEGQTIQRTLNPTGAQDDRMRDDGMHHDGMHHDDMMHHDGAGMYDDHLDDDAAVFGDDLDGQVLTEQQRLERQRMQEQRTRDQRMQDQHMQDQARMQEQAWDGPAQRQAVYDGPMPNARAEYQPTASGARLILTAANPQQIDQLRTHARNHVQHMQAGHCPMPRRAPTT